MNKYLIQDLVLGKTGLTSDWRAIKSQEEISILEQLLTSREFMKQMS